jgi:hypothetical protein
MALRGYLICPAICTVSRNLDDTIQQSQAKFRIGTSGNNNCN